MRASEIELLLPDVMRRALAPGTPMTALLAVMEDLHAPSEAILDDLPAVVDPLRTPDRFVPMLARWVDLQRLNDAEGGGVEDARMRLLIAISARIGRRRGTARGLLEVLELATGHTGFGDRHGRTLADPERSRRRSADPVPHPGHRARFGGWAAHPGQGDRRGGEAGPPDRGGGAGRGVGPGRAGRSHGVDAARYPASRGRTGRGRRIGAA